MECLFCEIIAGNIPSAKVYEDDYAYAFLDISPMKLGHTLVVPKRHVADYLSDDQAIAEISPAIIKVGKLLAEKLGADGSNLISNEKAASGQEVFHLHFHIIPRFADDPGFAALLDSAAPGSHASDSELFDQAKAKLGI